MITLWRVCQGGLSRINGLSLTVVMEDLILMHDTETLPETVRCFGCIVESMKRILIKLAAIPRLHAATQHAHRSQHISLGFEH